MLGKWVIPVCFWILSSSVSIYAYTRDKEVHSVDGFVLTNQQMAPAENFNQEFKHHKIASQEPPSDHPQIFSHHHKFIPKDRAEHEEDQDKSKEHHENDKEHQEHARGHHFIIRDHRRVRPLFYSTVIIPSGFASISANGQVYYYKEGIFYQLTSPPIGDSLSVSHQLVPVGAPIGAIVEDVPTSRSYVTIDDEGYSIYDGVYYKMTAEGHYQVVEPPKNSKEVSVIASEDEDSVTVNVPNVNSQGYTAVTLMRTEDGFTGPQGEFYSELPSMSQLITMYGE